MNLDTKELDEIISTLQQLANNPTSTYAAYLVLGRNNRPMLANNSFILCFTSQSTGQSFIQNVQSRVPDPLSLLPLEHASVLWTILSSKPSYEWQPPYGFVIDYGAPSQKAYDKEEVLMIGSDPFKKGLESLPHPGTVTLRIKLNDKESDSTLDEIVEKLNSIYAKTNDGILTNQAKEEVRTIGNALNAVGGMGLMLLVHSKFKELNRMMARGLEHAWDGIGDWQG